MNGMKIDLTPILQAVIALLASIITYKLVPWLQSRLDAQQMENLHVAAKVAVFAAEQLAETGVIRDKLSYVKYRLEEQGYDLDEETIRDAIENAVQELKATPIPKNLTNFVEPVRQCTPVMKQ
jgi:uncharacterized membrane protein YhiD involved in acid resistance